PKRSRQNHACPSPAEPLASRCAFGRYRIMFGARVKRIEDPALLRGRGRFVDDITFPDLLHAAFVRSPLAHARVRGIDKTAALALPGVHAVLTLVDLRPHIAND